MHPHTPKTIIHSPSNPLVKKTVRLRDASNRRRSGCFLIDGRREIELAVRSGIELQTLFYNGDSALWQEIPAGIHQAVSPEILARLSYGQRGDAPVAVAITPRLSLDRLAITSSSLVLVLDRTEKPGNLGAVVRTASACGVDAVILTDPVCEVFNPNAIRASRGTVFTVPIACTTAEDFQALCRASGLRLSCARVDGHSNLWQHDFSGGSVLVFGNEAEGLGKNWSGADIESFFIPMHGTSKHGAADSLNLSISAAITLYEALRQRTSAQPNGLI